MPTSVEVATYPFVLPRSTTSCTILMPHRVSRQVMIDQCNKSRRFLNSMMGVRIGKMRKAMMSRL